MRPIWYESGQINIRRKKYFWIGLRVSYVLKRFDTKANISATFKRKWKLLTHNSWSDDSGRRPIT